MFLLVVPDGVAQLVARRLAHLRCCYVGEGRGPDPMAGYIYMASPTHEVFNASFFGGGSNSSCPLVGHARFDDDKS